MEPQSDPSKFTLNTTAPLYLFVDKNGNKVGQNVIGPILGVPGYSPNWQVIQVTVPTQASEPMEA